MSKTSLMVAEVADGGHGTMSVDKTDLDRVIEEARKGGLVIVRAGATASGQCVKENENETFSLGIL